MTYSTRNLPKCGSTKRGRTSVKCRKKTGRFHTPEQTIMVCSRCPRNSWDGDDDVLQSSSGYPPGEEASPDPSAPRTICATLTLKWWEDSGNGNQRSRRQTQSRPTHPSWQLPGPYKDLDYYRGVWEPTWPDIHKVLRYLPLLSLLPLSLCLTITLLLFHSPWSYGRK